MDFELLTIVDSFMFNNDDFFEYSKLFELVNVVFLSIIETLVLLAKETLFLVSFQILVERHNCFEHIIINEIFQALICKKKA